MKAYEINSKGIDALALTERESAPLGPRQVRVQIRASSLNYRDLLTVMYGGMGGKLPLIPNSDGCGEILETGSEVTLFNVGDKVVTTFFQRWISGEISADVMQSSLGGAMDGVLAEEIVLDELGVVALPEHMSFEEGATLSCAALTAWQSMVVKGGVKAGDIVLALGTGGVSIFALQFAVMHGAQVMITSSSDEKLERAKQLGAWQTINYNTDPDWHKTVLKLTDGQGVDQVLEVGGAGTLEKSLTATRFGGMVGLIGILSGIGGAVNPDAILRKSINLQGIYVGSRTMFEDMNRALTAHQTRPVIDQFFDFDQAPDAYRCLEQQGHFGKVVIRY
ncbi:MAG: NAD(P)-dependent alcohol dehydrogenase [Gammaproteobacteria bacterium]|nr:MAG: NAD(P)-dependent alcohol dehydrogenase [Gammaproteobacteria bacterium]RLA50086.1 MAG: NAD(P)-dependent alcohol dehydrogenase [Gammaproteobacteria bacterium]